jgi:membrane fusion protein (multidrug efflux system)
MSLSLAGCGDSAEQDEKAPTPQVRVETLQLQPLAISSELSGRILAPRTAEVRARVAGVVLKRVYREGSDVKQGDVLFLIDPAPFKADHDSARATLARAEATLYQARLHELRYR